ncbi:GDP-L-fucose synthase [Candidatus Dependentiae bacterium]|nr:GDP-L-fucose synthase [Candidatus Dependentiae bacterium]
MNKRAKIYIAGHRGLVGSALMRMLRKNGYTNFITATRGELDLCDQRAVNSFFEEEKPEYVFLSAAKVGGILANDTYSADFIYDNIMIAANVIHVAYRHKVKKLIFLGSSCIYPRECPQPMKEEYLLTGPLEPTNEWYAIAKISGIKLCQAYNKQHDTNFIVCMPTNLYGIGDNFHGENSHVIPALIKKFHAAKINNEEEVVVWGTGSPRREFLFVDDLADAVVFLMNNYNGSEIINIGTGIDMTIKELALSIKEVIGFQGRLVFDITKPDGTPQKLLAVDKINQLGWHAQINFFDGLTATYKWYQEYVV